VTNNNAPAQQNSPSGSNGGSPRGAFVAGMVFFATGVLFLMVVILLSMSGVPIPCQVHMPIILVIALILATGSTFTISHATISGNVPVPFLRNHPLPVSLGGGFAAFFLLVLLGPTIWPCPTSRVEVTILSANIDGPNPSGQLLLTITFNPVDVPTGAKVTLKLSRDRESRNVIRVEPISDWAVKQYTTPLSKDVLSEIQSGVYVSLSVEVDGQTVAHDVYQNMVKPPVASPATATTRSK